MENNEAGNVFDEVNAFFSTNLDFEKIRLLGIFEEFEDFESVKQFVQHMQVDHSKVTRLEKYAAISNQRWLAQVLEFENKTWLNKMAANNGIIIFRVLFTSPKLLFFL